MLNLYIIYFHDIQSSIFCIISVTIERPMPVFDLKNRTEFNANTNQKKSSSRIVLSQIRRGGINFKIRCKTSADLWRRWISAGDKDNKINEDEKVFLVQ
jgi:hypothetical protein